MIVRCFLLAATVAAVALPAAADTRIRTDDIDISTPAGVERLQNRIASVARRECSGEDGTASRTDGGTARCERQMRGALTRSLPPEVRERIQPTPPQGAAPAR